MRAPIVGLSPLAGQAKADRDIAMGIRLFAGQLPRSGLPAYACRKLTDPGPETFTFNPRSVSRPVGNERSVPLSFCFLLWAAGRPVALSHFAPCICFRQPVPRLRKQVFVLDFANRAASTAQ